MNFIAAIVWQQGTQPVCHSL